MKGVDDDDVLNMRDVPNGKQIVGTVPADGRGLEGLGPRAKSEGGTWLQIRYGDLVGWVNKRFLRPDALATGAVARASADGAALRSDRFNGTWHHDRWIVRIDGERIALDARRETADRSRALAAGSRDCGNVYDRNLATMEADQIPAVFTDPRFHVWALGAAQGRPLLVMVVTCGAASHRYVFFLTEQRKMLVAEWDTRDWLMYAEFQPDSRQVRGQ